MLRPGFFISLPNLIVAASNLYALRAVALSFPSLQAWCILFAAVCSTAYHLIERHKHQMPGASFGRSVRAHLWLINLDRVAAVIAAVVCMPYLLQDVPLLTVLVALGSITASEQLADRTNDPVWVHTIWHSLWHIAVFHLAYIAVGRARIV